MTLNSTNAPFHIGTHWTQQEGPLLVFRPEGVIMLRDNQELFSHLRWIKQEHGRVYILLDAVHNAQQDPEGRTWASKHISNANRPNGVAIIRAGFQARVLLKLFVRAAQLLHRFDVPLEFFSTEEAGRAFLAGLDAAFIARHSRRAL